VTRLARSLIGEITPLYVASLAVLLLLLLVNVVFAVLAEALSRDVPISLVARFVLYKLPVVGAQALTLALLFATLITLGRWIGDRELKSALTLGVTPAALLRPLLALGAAVAFMSVVNNEVLVPWAETQAMEVQKDILLESPRSLLQEDRFFKDGRGRSIFLDAIGENGAVDGVVMIVPGGPQGPRQLVEAGRGRLNEARGTWELSDVRFRTFTGGRPTLDMQAEQATVPVQGLSAVSVGRTDLKAAEPLAALAFVAFALGLALNTVRSRLLVGVPLVLMLTFVYYAVWSVMKLLGAQGAAPAWLAAWTPVTLYTLAATVLLARTRWRL
jgi:lipopolysaccharide export system permease protein